MKIWAQMAEQMGITIDDLEPGEAYITVAGTLEAPRGVSKKAVEFLSGRGTKNPASSNLPVVVSYSTCYTVLISIELIATVGGCVDTWTRQFVYRSDWDIGDIAWRPCHFN